jgi:hypothetical protein
VSYPFFYGDEFGANVCVEHTNEDPMKPGSSSPLYTPTICTLYNTMETINMLPEKLTRSRQCASSRMRSRSDGPWLRNTSSTLPMAFAVMMPSINHRYWSEICPDPELSRPKSGSPTYHYSSLDRSSHLCLYRRLLQGPTTRRNGRIPSFFRSRIRLMAVFLTTMAKPGRQRRR